MRRLLPLLLVALLALLAGCGSAEEPASVTEADPARAVALIEDGSHTVLDVRTPEEYAAGHVDGALNLDASADDFTEQLAELDQDAAYLVYCQTGNRSASATALMVEEGFATVVDAGGIEELEPAGAPMAAGD